MDCGNDSLNRSFEQGRCLNSENTQSHKSNNIQHTTEAFVDNNGETLWPCVNLDLFDYSLPPTPETSPHLWPEKDEQLLLDNRYIVDSSLSGDFSGSLFINQAELDHEESHTYVNTKTSELNQETSKQMHEEKILREKATGETSISNASRKQEFDKESTDNNLSESVSKKVENIPKKMSVSKSCDKKSRASGLLQFPPCVICSGKSSGSHYGAITCEACKGFFRRHLQKKTNFKCFERGKCKIVSSKKGMCSGCRLKKCLDIGMSKEKSKMGRYTLTKRTEAIISMNLRDRKHIDDQSQLRKNNATESVDENGKDPTSLNEEESLLKTHLLQGPMSLNLSQGFNDLLVTELVQCFSAYDPYGPNIKTKEQIAQAHKALSEKYKQKIELFGKMKATPRDEYNEIYTQFGIDLDGRMADMKLGAEDIDSDMTFFCNFAKHIPEFHSFPLQDKLSLLNSLMIDFYTIVFLDCYSDEYKTFIYKNGQGYHFEECAGRELSEQLTTISISVYCRLQMLNLSIEERALMAALTIVSSDRCKLQNRALVEKVQVSLTELLQTYLKKTRKEAGNGRFAKIIDSLTFMRELTDLYKTESNELCKDEVLLKEFPRMKEFIVEENY